MMEFQWEQVTAMSLVGVCALQSGSCFHQMSAFPRQQKANEMNLLEANAVVVGFCSALSAMLFGSCIPTCPPELVYNLSCSDHVWMFTNVA